MDNFNYTRKAYPSADGDLAFTTAQTTATIETAKSATHTIYITRIIVWIKTDAAQSLTFQDNNGTPVIIAKIPTSPGADTRWDFDFGPKGVPLTLGKNLTATFSAAGLAGHMEWYGYQKK
jgi:hypothetical protein